MEGNVRTTTGRTRPAPQGLRPILIMEGWDPVAEVQARNLPDALRRFAGERPWLQRPLVTGNVLTVTDGSVDREFYSKDPA